MTRNLSDTTGLYSGNNRPRRSTADYTRKNSSPVPTASERKGRSKADIKPADQASICNSVYSRPFQSHGLDNLEGSHSPTYSRPSIIGQRTPSMTSDIHTINPESLLTISNRDATNTNYGEDDYQLTTYSQTSYYSQPSRAHWQSRETEEVESDYTSISQRDPYHSKKRRESRDSIRRSSSNHSSDRESISSIKTTLGNQQILLNHIIKTMENKLRTLQAISPQPPWLYQKHSCHCLYPRHSSFDYNSTRGGINQQGHRICD